jgi:hypothetical protein
LLRSAAFHSLTIVFFFYKITCLNDEVNCIEPPPSVRVPWLCLSGHASLGWAGLGWAGLGWAGLGWAGLGWAGLGWVDKDFIKLRLLFPETKNNFN